MSQHLMKKKRNRIHAILFSHMGVMSVISIVIVYVYIIEYNTKADNLLHELHSRPVWFILWSMSVYKLCV